MRVREANSEKQIANRNIMKALIVEGGALRTVFSAGVLDAFLVNKFDPFDLYIGVSGGSMSMTYFLSKSYQATYEITKKIIADTEFMGLKNIFSEEGYINLAYLQEYADRSYPLDIPALEKISRHKKIEIVATNIEDGTPVYLWPTIQNWRDCLKASSTLPFLTKGYYWVNDLKLMDGGWADPIPARRAVELGADQVVVIRSQPLTYRSDWHYFGVLGQFINRNNPAMKDLFAREHIVYNEALDFLNEEHVEQIIQIAPPDYLKTTAYSATEEKLTIDYRTGLDMGLRFMAEYGGGF